MDGNGRWAQRRGITRVEGHKRGKDSVRAVVETSRRLGIKYLSLFAFSTENWQRPRREVEALMGLLRRYLRTELRKMMKNEIRLLAIGDLTRLPPALQADLQSTIDATKNNPGMTVVLAVSYGGREDMVQAARKLACDARSGRIDPEKIDARVLDGYFSTAGIPDPDLLIRTSGEMRISNFFLWQLAYSEIYVTETLWPDFREIEFMDALAVFQQRERRFGRILEHQEAEQLRAAR
ncbi:MAG: di-trans,poly-cis-decaprenylcistransferase [Deltaproteobacteria bacterium]|nr:di-trans,poly-cis-decaprenylcistransferase [Deltaproteobacteria bacterium]